MNLLFNSIYRLGGGRGAPTLGGDKGNKGERAERKEQKRRDPKCQDRGEGEIQALTLNTIITA